MNQKAGRIAAAILGLALHAGLADARWQASVPSGDDFETYRDRSHGELVERLERHASFCRGKRAFDEYGKTLQLILEFDPANNVALKGLGYRKRGRDWVAPKKPKTFENKDERSLEQIDERFREAIEPFLETHTEWVRTGELTDAEQRDALVDILRIDPANPVAASAPVELRAAAAQLLPETLIARERRVQLGIWVREGFREAPPAKPRCATGALMK